MPRPWTLTERAQDRRVYRWRALRSLAIERHYTGDLAARDRYQAAAERIGGRLALRLELRLMREMGRAK
jgi:hypothetical protein